MIGSLFRLLYPGNNYKSLDGQACNELLLTLSTLFRSADQISTIQAKFLHQKYITFIHSTYEMTYYYK